MTEWQEVLLRVLGSLDHRLDLLEMDEYGEGCDRRTQALIETLRAQIIRESP